MVDLRAKPAFGDLLPLTIGTVTLSEEDPGPLSLVMPFRGQQQAVAGILRDGLRLGWSEPNKHLRSGDASVMWFGREAALLAGAECPAMDGLAAITDQSDGWACVRLTGGAGVDVLARLVPVDLRPAVFPPGMTARTLLGHMNASITRLDDDSLLILVFRSMAATLVDEIKEAMEAVAPRG